MLLIAYPFIAAFVGYLIGSIPFGLIFGKIFGYDDIRKIGSGNIGATNALRTGNKLYALITLFFDLSKGAFAYYIFADTQADIDRDVFGLGFLYIGGFAAALFAVIGHCFPIWLKFKGGKGVATAFGVLIAAVPLAALVAATTWGIVAGFFRISSLAALAASGIAPLATLLLYGPMPAGIVLLITLLIIWKHKDNIKRLLAGTEPKIGAKKGSNTEDTKNTE